MTYEPHLKIFLDRSILVDTKGQEVIFKEGPPNDAARERHRRIKSQLEKGWLRSFIERTIRSPSNGLELEEKHRELLDKLVASMTSEVGRALVGITILQLTVKAIEPNQSVRLHKAGHGDFSWVDGIPMRTLDTDYVTPILREFELLRLNIYGFMMTRSLAENYPYSKFYKAAIRGGKNEWLEIADELENGSLKQEAGLAYLISILSNRSTQFRKLADETINLMREYIQTKPSFEQVWELIDTHVRESMYQARLLEVAMHSLLQVAEDRDKIDGFLLPLLQMRTANKKHRNVGDVEIVAARGSRRVTEAWDAKFGKPYLRDELDELDEKLDTNEYVNRVGFVTDSEPILTSDIRERIEEIQNEHGTEVKLLSFYAWVNLWMSLMNEDEDEVARLWLEAYVGSICQKRRDRAPIDEPTEEWVKYMRDQLRKRLRTSQLGSSTSSFST